MGSRGGQRSDWNMHRPTEIHMRYHSGQYLFFIPFNTGPVVTKEERAYQEEQHENWGTISTVPPKLEARGRNAPRDFPPDHAHAICPLCIRPGIPPERRNTHLVW
jgi:hypothetical protein